MMHRTAVDPVESHRLAGRLLILAAAVLWSTSGLFAKSPAFANWPVLVDGWAVRGPSLAFWRALFACAILLPLVRRPRWTPRLLPAALAFAAMNFTFLTAMTTTTAANAIWLQYTAPAWVLLFSVLVHRERVARPDGWLLVFGLSGVAVILLFELRNEASGGVVYGLLAGVTFAAVQISLRWLRDQDAAWLVAVNHMLTAVLFLPYVIRWGARPEGIQWWYLALFGTLQMGLPYLLFARGVRGVTSQEASGILLLEPLLVPGWVYLAWRNHPSYESPDWWTWAGGALILTGLVVRYAGRFSRRSALAVQSTQSG